MTLSPPGQRRCSLLVVAALIALAAIFVRLAWLSDDACITLRSVENLATGHGARWNANDRVQTFTHPLWMLVLAAGRWLTGESYGTTIAISCGLSLAAAWLMLQVGKTGWLTIAAAMVMANARAFPEYATSGLETPATYLLLVVFVATVVDRPEGGARRYFLAVATATLLACNRLDLALLVLPGVLATMRGVMLRQVLALGVLGALPLVAWLAFATIYYGSPFPVTAHAKLFGLGIDESSLWQQGFFYLRHGATDDPVLVGVLVLGFVVGVGVRRTRIVALGIPAYVIYVIKVGGDFMAGRFLLPPFVLALGLLLRALSRVRVGWSIALVVGVVGASCWRGLPPWLHAPAADTVPTRSLAETRGIVDERRVYYHALGLLSPTRGIPRFEAMTNLLWPEGRERRWFALTDAAGVMGLHAGRTGHLVDAWLCDPLLARLPARDPERWRIGHVDKRWPEGYLESLASGTNQLHHPGLRRYYAALRTITEEPVLAPGRLSVLWQMLRGDFDDDLRAFVREEYRSPPRIVIAASALAGPVRLGVRWFDEPRARVSYEGGLAIDLGGSHAVRRLHLSLAGSREWRVQFVAAGAVVATSVVHPPGDLLVQQLLQEVAVDVPAVVQAFDTLWLDAQVEPLVPPAIAGLRLEP